MAPHPLIALAALLVSVTPSVTEELESARCIRESAAPLAAGELLDDAIEVLAACGHDPAAYRAELHMEEAFALIGSGRRPEISVVFEPVAEGYPLEVSPAAPCVVGWLWVPERFTDWQRSVLDRARQRLPQVAFDEVQVHESRDVVAVTARHSASDAPPAQVRMRKGDTLE